MKKLTFLLTFIAIAVLIASCDKMEGPYLQYDESVETTVEFPDLDKTTVYKKILVEEFTGHKCPNCPDGHRILNTLSDTYGDTLITVCVHTGAFATPTSSFPNDYRTTEGTELATNFSISSYPSTVFNQSQYNGAYGVSKDNWAQAIGQVNHQPAIAAIQIINEFSGSTLTVHTKTTLLTEHESPVKLALFVIEDGIVSPQIDGSTTIEDYVHNHVMRGSLNGTFGSYISEGGMVAADSSYTKSYQLDCADKSWNFSRCSVVAILMDATPDSREVLQVEKCPFMHE